MKAKKSKKNLKEYFSKHAVLIKCEHCKINDSCIRRERKERDENKNIRTFCTLTPNKARKNIERLYKSNKKIIQR